MHYWWRLGLRRLKPATIATVALPDLHKRLPYRKIDYPNVAFWTRKNYDDARALNALVVIHDAAADTTKIPFMVHEDGTPLSEEEAVKIRASARGIFAQFLHDGTRPGEMGSSERC